MYRLAFFTCWYNPDNSYTLDPIREKSIAELDAFQTQHSNVSNHIYNKQCIRHQMGKINKLSDLFPLLWTALAVWMTLIRPQCWSVQLKSALDLSMCAWVNLKLCEVLYTMDKFEIVRICCVMNDIVFSQSQVRDKRKKPFLQQKINHKLQEYHWKCFLRAIGRERKWKKKGSLGNKTNEIKY